MKGGLKLGILADLIKYLGILFIGALIGYKDLVKGKLGDNLGLIQDICLLFLLFTMGITIGLNEEVVNNILGLGFKALVISICTIIFSILSVRVIKGLVITKGGKQWVLKFLQL